MLAAVLAVLAEVAAAVPVLVLARAAVVVPVLVQAPVVVVFLALLAVHPALALGLALLLAV